MKTASYKNSVRETLLSSISKTVLVRKSNLLAWLAGLILVLSTSNELSAQRISTGSRAATIAVSINSTPVPASNVAFLDSVNRTNEKGMAQQQVEGYLIHQLSFDLDLGSADGTNILKTLYAAMPDQLLNSVSIAFLSSTGQVLNGKTFTSVAIKEIRFPELNASASETPKATVILQADYVSDYADYNGRPISAPSRSRTNSAGMFTLTFNNLPVQNILRIGSMRFIPSLHSNYWNIDMEINSTDAGPWNQWITAAGASGPGIQAVINLFDERGLPGNFSILLTQLEVVAVGILGNAGNNATTRIRLRTTNLPVIQ